MNTGTRRPLKMLNRLLCLFGLLGAAGLLVGCRSNAPSSLAFPPDADTVLETVQALGFDWTLPEEDIVSHSQDQVSYSLYSEQYLGALIGCSMFHGTRLIQVTFGASIVPETPEFSWTDWEKQFSLAEQLYGEFAGAGELYSAFSSQEIPEAEPMTQLHGKLLRWEAELPAAYCVVTWRAYGATVVHDQVSPQDWTSRLTMLICQSEDVYSQLFEAAQPER